MKHAFRAQDTPNADHERTPENTHIGANSVAEGMAAFRGALPEKLRKNGVLAIEYLMTASPEAMNCRTRTEQDAYFSDALDWLRERHGAENVIYAGIHRDEQTPHMYAYVVPKDPDTGRLNARRWFGGAKALSEMQTEFAERVGLPHGLERGIQGSKARHTTIKKFYSALEGELKKQNKLIPSHLKPLVLKKGFLSNEIETPEVHAKRLTDMIQEHYAPALLEASSARLERTRADGLAKTVKAQAKALKPLQELTEGLSTPQMMIMMQHADEMRRENELAAKALAAAKALDDAKKAQAKAALEVKAEAERRVAALKKVSKQHMTAGMTFGKMAIKAIKAAGDDWKKVDWPKLEQEAIAALVENEWPADQALKAILDHSPDRASLTESEIAHELSQINRVKSTNKAAPDAAITIVAGG